MFDDCKAPISPSILLVQLLCFWSDMVLLRYRNDNGIMLRWSAFGGCALAASSLDSLDPVILENLGRGRQMLRSGDVYVLMPNLSF